MKYYLHLAMKALRRPRTDGGRLRACGDDFSTTSQVRLVEVSFSAAVYTALHLIVPLTTNLRRMPVHLVGTWMNIGQGWFMRIEFIKTG